jgi:hypothetical protein
VEREAVTEEERFGWDVVEECGSSDWAAFQTAMVVGREESRDAAKWANRGGDCSKTCEEILAKLWSGAMLPMNQS